VEYRVSTDQGKDALVITKRLNLSLRSGCTASVAVEGTVSRKSDSLYLVSLDSIEVYALPIYR
jgi:hypothetical protein